MVSLLLSYYIATINIYVLMTLSSKKLASLSEPEKFAWVLKNNLLRDKRPSLIWTDVNFCYRAILCNQMKLWIGKNLVALTWNDIWFCRSSVFCYLITSLLNSAVSDTYLPQFVPPSTRVFALTLNPILPPLKSPSSSVWTNLYNLQYIFFFLTHTTYTILLLYICWVQCKRKSLLQ